MKIGILEWFRPGEYEQVERVLQDLEILQVQHLRTGISWADWHTPAGYEWYNWLFPQLAKAVEVLPCFHYTPPSLGVVAKTSAPPRRPQDYADFIDEMITRFGEHFEWVELWNEPNNLSDWDWRLDPQWRIFCEMVGGAAYWAQQRGKKTVLAGMAPVDPNWLQCIADRGVLQYINAVGLHGFPGTWEFDWQEWSVSVEKVQAVLDRYGLTPQLWITETGYSTWRQDEYQQLQVFVKAIAAPVERIYWYSAYNLHPDVSSQDGFHVDERHYHTGLKHSDGTPKLLYRLWATEGLAAVQAMAQTSVNMNISEPAPPILITGGAGFIGTNLAHRLLSAGMPVRIFDNLSRAGVEKNLRWLQQTHGSLLQVEIADIRDRYAVRRVMEGVETIFHLAAQVAVTSSLNHPRHDFEVNVTGTLNLLEEMRRLSHAPALIFTSTNKVYGNLDEILLRQHSTRYEPVDQFIRRFGVWEDRPLNFHTPYGCSKGAADQYVLDYARSFGLKCVVFRMSCIYGPHQFGTEDQGWVAHFLIRALEQKPITLYGDGKQVRDILFVEDLLDAFLAAKTQIQEIAGEAFNIGGGPENSLSLIELINWMNQIHQQNSVIQFEDWRWGDQKYYVSDFSKFQAVTGWTPQTNFYQGLLRLYQWLNHSQSLEFSPIIHSPSNHHEIRTH
jgi:CDP-paratose 2-epimerase